MLLCAITDRRLFGEDEQQRREELITRVRGWARGGVDYIQIREKDLPAVELLELSCKLVAAVRDAQPGSVRTRVLLNGPAEIAFEAGADGVHLAGDRLGSIGCAGEIYERAGRRAIIGQSCHSVEEVVQANAASLILFAPVFEKRLREQEAICGQGLAALADACRVGLAAETETPVLALGGVTAENAGSCVEAGAAGIAAIRLFLGDDWRQLRKL